MTSPRQSHDFRCIHWCFIKALQGNIIKYSFRVKASLIQIFCRRYQVHKNQISIGLNISKIIMSFWCLIEILQCILRGNILKILFSLHLNCSLVISCHQLMSHVKSNTVSIKKSNFWKKLVMSPKIWWLHILTMVPAGNKAKHVFCWPTIPQKQFIIIIIIIFIKKVT